MSVCYFFAESDTASLDPGWRSGPVLNCCFNIIILGGTNLRVLGPRSDRVPIYVQQLEPYDETKILQNLLRSGAHATCVPADLLLCLIVKLRFVAGFRLRLLLFVCCGGFKGIVSAVPDLFGGVENSGITPFGLVVSIAN